ncbi:MAG: hypothetical protein MRERV_36c036 [Mycoplasmataceae bacterium RV_VA103A]|nr:MAG: hypothetical protein MRERV_36c036 [Mycoplasmataceae bacterium RV_VA103A]
MNNLNTSNLKDDVSTRQLSGEADNRLSILSWKSKKIPQALILKFQGQRYLGLIRKDKKGQEYWRYHPLTPFTELSKSDQVKKYEQSNSESASNNSSQ